MYAWEPVFEQKIAELRRKEVVKQRTINILSAVQETITYVVPILVSDGIPKNSTVPRIVQDDGNIHVVSPL